MADTLDHTATAGETAMASVFPPAIRRRTLLATGGALLAAPARAQNYPDRPVRIVVPYPAGGTTDILARLVGQKVGERLGQPFVIENRSGATGVIGSEHVARSAPDGHTLLMGVNGPITISPAFRRDMPYEPLRAFAPVTLVASVAKLLVVNPQLPVRSVAELVAYAKARPGQLSFASSGTGATGHLAGEMFKLRAGLDIVHVPYRGGAPAMADVIAGRVAMQFEVLTQLLPQVRGGQLRALAVTSAERLPTLPDIPTVAEQGFPGFESRTWFGLLAPAGTPPAIVRRLRDEVVQVLTTPEMVQFLREQGADPIGNTPEQFAAFLREDTERWADVVRRSGARLE
jgi:tripartite-type tricarboxylate transporter receptor subunit TctC